MQIPRPSHKSIPSLTQRWEVPGHAIVEWAMQGHFQLATTLPAARSGEATISGVVGVHPSDVYALFRREEPAHTVAVRRVSTKRGAWRAITWPADGVPARRGDIMVELREVERFELIHGLLNATLSELLEQVKAESGGTAAGVQERYDWDAMFGAAMRRIHDEGIPPKQEELVRDMQSWFASRDANAVPDVRHIRRKLRPAWQVLQAE